jgi:hypothetical protein
MFIPPQFRPFVIGIYVLISWKFLTLGAILFGAALLAMIDLRPQTPAFFIMGAFFSYVGVLAFQRLRHVLEQPTL